jgi:uncharacterized membrane protein
VGGVAPAAAPAPAYTASAGMASNVAGLLAYILGPITGTAFLLIEPYREDRFVRFHAFQSILFSIAAGVLLAGLRFLLSLLSMITFRLGGLLGLGLMAIFSLFFFLFWLFLLFKAYSNERFMVPYVGPIAASAAEMPATSPNLNGFLAYVLGFISGIILLMNESTKHDRFVRFHAVQSIFFSVVLFVLWIIYVVLVIGLAIAGGLIFIEPFIRLVWLALYAYYLVIMSKAYHNELYKVPVIGDLAAKQAGM